MSTTEIISELPKLTRSELEAVDARLHELLGAAKSPNTGQRNWGEAVATLAATITDLPADYALNHDHYVHGAPKR